MEIVVDTSVWSYFLRRKSPARNPALEKLRSHLEQGPGVILLGPIDPPNCFTDNVYTTSILPITQQNRCP